MLASLRYHVQDPILFWNAVVGECNRLDHTAPEKKRDQAGAIVSLAVFSLCHFTKTEADSSPNRKTADGIVVVASVREKVMRIFRDPEAASVSSKKRLRNTIYRVCGWMIVGSLALIVVNNLLDWGLMFWFESVAVLAFGVSWLVKSGLIRQLMDDSTNERIEEVRQATTWT